MKNYIISEDVYFCNRPEAVPYKYRISYKIAQTCLIIFTCCRSGGASTTKIHLISMALSNNQDKIKLLEFLENRMSQTPIIKFDPAVNRAILFALGEKLLIQQKNGKYKLTDQGKKFVAELFEDDKILEIEKDILHKISNRLTEKMIDEIVSQWRYISAEN